MLNVAVLLHQTWDYRGFIYSSVHREVYGRYTGSLLGVGWVVIHPLALILLYTLVFANLMRPVLPNHESVFAYSVFLCAGVLTWMFFSELVGRCLGIFVNHANLLKKVSFPKLTLPVIAILASLMNFMVVLALFQVLLVLIGFFPGWVLLAAVPVIGILVMFTIGLGLLAGTLNVFYRDIEQSFAVILLFWFWFTPIVYPASILPQWVLSILVWNPLFPIVQAMQTIFLEHTAPDWLTLLYPLALSLLFLGLGFFAYLRLGDEIVDEL